MNKEAEEAGMKPVFEATETTETPAPKADETAAKQTDETKVDDAKTEKSAEVKPDENKSRQSRAPFREARERMKEGLEKKYEEKFGKEINDLKSQLEEMKKGNLTKTETTDLKADIESLATELKLDPVALEKIISVSRKGVDSELTQVKNKLSEYESKEKERSEERIIAEQEEIFNEEFKEVLPSIKEQFPNASREQIEAAKEKLDELAHSEKYAEVELDYVLYKEKEELGKILFSPKVRGPESDSTNEETLEDDSENSIFNGKTPTSIADLERLDRKTKEFESGLTDSRYTLK